MNAVNINPSIPRQKRRARPLVLVALLCVGSLAVLLVGTGVSSMRILWTLRNVPTTTATILATPPRKRNTSVHDPQVVGLDGIQQPHAPDLPVDSLAFLPNREYFNLSPPVCPTAFLEHLQFLAAKITNRWKANGWGKRFGRADISRCSLETPECKMWLELPIAVSDVMNRASTENDSVGSQRLTGEEERRRRQLPFRKCCVEHRQLRDTAWFVIEQLERSNVTYFLSTGSALGAIRHSGTIVPWDTDVDIAIFPNDADKVRSIFSSAVVFGKSNDTKPATRRKVKPLHFFNDDPQGKPMYWVHHSASGQPAGGPHVEIFFDAVYTAYPKQLLPLRTCPFYGREVYCPSTGMFDVWFPGGWTIYGGGHYHGPNRCTIYHKGKRIEQAKCS